MTSEGILANLRAKMPEVDFVKVFGIGFEVSEYEFLEFLSPEEVKNIRDHTTALPAEIRQAVNIVESVIGSSPGN